MIINTNSLESKELEVANLYNSNIRNRYKTINYLSHEDELTYVEPSNCLIKVEPVKLEKPMRLFGSKIKSINVNKITICQAIINKKTNEYTCGDEIITALISDESLSKAVFNSNNCEENPCTYTSLLGSNLREQNNPNNILNSVDLQNRNKSKGFENSKSYFNEYLEKIEKALSKSSLTKKDAEELRVMTTSAVDNPISNVSYSIKVLAEELNKDLTSVKLEMINTVEKSNKYYKNQNTLCLDYKEEVLDKIRSLRYLMNGEYSTEERFLLAKIFKDIKEKEEDSKKREILSSLISSFSNVYKSECYENAFESNGSISLSKVHGNIDLFGEMVEGRNFISLKLTSSYISNQRNSAKINPVVTFASFHLSMETLFLLLRGTKDSDFLPCTMYRLNNISIPFKGNYKTKEESLIDDVSYDYNNHTLKMKEIKNKILELLKTKISKKEDKDKFRVLVSQLKFEFYKNIEEIEKMSEKDSDLMVSIFKEKLEENFNSITKSLPKEEREEILKMINSK